MTAGTLALWISAILGVVATVLSIAHSPRYRAALAGSVVAVWVAVAVAIAALVREDTSSLLVVDHTRPELLWPRRVMGLWGGSAGSLLLFTAILGLVLVFAPTRRSARWFGPVVVATLAGTLLAVTSPFETLETPAIRGSGMSPILEHWAMLIHPPLLYSGLAFALVPGLAGSTQKCRRWTTAALVALTASLALGGRWAYVELGWGGWWAWDPVENVALIPWLLLVVHVHLPARHRVASWTALAAWPAVFAGTAMTRTSLRTSVHSFANADGLGWTLWPLTVVVAGAALLLAARERGPLRGRAATLTAASVVIFTAVVVALGTFRPFLPGEATAGWFYTRSLYPIAVGGLIAMGVGPRWRTESPRRLVGEAGVGLVLGLFLALVGGWTVWFQIVLAGALGAAVVPTLAGAPHARIARTLGHLGMAAVLAGALGGTASTSVTVDMAQSETRMVNGVSLSNTGITIEEGEPTVISASLDVGGRTVRPSIGVYVSRGLRLPEVSTVHGVFVDHQFILRDADDDGSITVTVNRQPFTTFVWVGAVLLAVAFAVRVRSLRRAAPAELSTAR